MSTKRASLILVWGGLILLFGMAATANRHRPVAQAPEPPMEPEFFLVPGNGSITVLWRPSPTEALGDLYWEFVEDAGTPSAPNPKYDPNYRRFDVEGYRVYRGEADDAATFSMVAQFDYSGTFIEDFAGLVNPRPGCAPELGVRFTCPVPYDPIVPGAQLIVHNAVPLVGEVVQVRVGDRQCPFPRHHVCFHTDIEVADTAITGNDSQLPELSDTGVPFVFMDNTVDVCRQYFYSVSAFDLNSWQSGPSSLESHRTSRSVGPLSPVAAMALSPASATIGMGESVQFDLVAETADGTPCSPSVVWAATGGGVTDGLYTAGTAPGTYEITASATTDGSTTSATAIVTIQDGTPDKIALINDGLTTNLSASIDGTPLGQIVPAGTETVVLVDGFLQQGATATCHNDMVRRFGDLLFENLKAIAGNCTSPPIALDDEIVVFSVDDRVVLDRGPGGNGHIWKDSPGDVETVDLTGGLRTVPVVLWVTKDMLDNGEAIRGKAEDDLQNTSLLYNVNRVGLAFSNIIREPWKDDGIPWTDTRWSWCNLPTTHFAQPDTINVYYVLSNGMMTDKGEHCHATDWNLVYISANNRSPTTLAHELGHAFSLEHSGQAIYASYPTTDLLADQAPLLEDNIMWKGSANRATLSLGQAFRINIDSNSALWKNKVWTHAVRACECRMKGNPPLCPGATSGNYQDFLDQSDSDSTCPGMLKTW